MMDNQFNNRLRQILLLGLILVLAIVFITQLYQFLPGLLGAITLYMLTRKWFQQLTLLKKWKPGFTAFLFILGTLAIIAVPVYLSVQLVAPKINSLVSNQHEVMQGLQVLLQKIHQLTGIQLMNTQNNGDIAKKIAAYLPTLLNSTANILTNLIMMYFLYYYLLVNGRALEHYLNRIIPLQPHNVDKLAAETNTMIRANAIGIPVICLVQGFAAAIGYLIFGVSDWGMWGFITGVFAFFPLVGTMIIWVPLVLFLYANNHSYQATGLLIYSIVVTGNVDYITRLGLLKKMGNVHPLITVLGVILGLQLFGFMGLIFGPLLISYFLILTKIYLNEFANEPSPKAAEQ